MSLSNEAIDVVVRFSTSNPDVVLSITNPEHVTIASLKQQLREQLPAPASNARLRLIHSGKVLVDDSAISSSVSITRPPPVRDDEAKSTKAKGKQPVRDLAPRVYIHCSIGDPLSSDELVEERHKAESADAALLSKDVNTGAGQQQQQHHETTTTPAPRGFDRLLAAGLAPAEVADLRAQFLAIQAHTHTPDTMPMSQELLALEERWLDQGAGGGAGDAQENGSFDSEDAGALEDMLYGNLIGFFWPIGGAFWLMREEGVWSRRRQFAVLSGFVINLTMGLSRFLS
ncbi:hypothetical protein CBER1_05134 [Cercospora berteroae]|uniref:Ubiquitin-like domain-containing protein n=1 Tax=Cercospora berteroae TaxID=357750 RepID=A0A2S6C3B3_9PEZI|nr:hypothetical protein CBER1_05134 [Cercospora berteroae]